MANKLDAGERFPDLTLQLVDGGTLVLPAGFGSKYTLALFYRGHW